MWTEILSYMIRQRSLWHGMSSMTALRAFVCYISSTKLLGISYLSVAYFWPAVHIIIDRNVHVVKRRCPYVWSQNAKLQWSLQLLCYYIIISILVGQVFLLRQDLLVKCISTHFSIFSVYGSVPSCWYLMNFVRHSRVKRIISLSWMILGFSWTARLSFRLSPYVDVHNVGNLFSLGYIFGFYYFTLVENYLLSMLNSRMALYGIGKRITWATWALWLTISLATRCFAD